MKDLIKFNDLLDAFLKTRLLRIILLKDFISKKCTVKRKFFFNINRIFQ